MLAMDFGSAGTLVFVAFFAFTTMRGTSSRAVVRGWLRLPTKPSDETDKLLLSSLSSAKLDAAASNHIEARGGALLDAPEERWSSDDEIEKDAPCSHSQAADSKSASQGRLLNVHTQEYSSTGMD